MTLFRKVRFGLVKKLLTSDEKHKIRHVLSPVTEDEMDLSEKDEKTARYLLDRKQVVSDMYWALL